MSYDLVTITNELGMAEAQSAHKGLMLRLGPLCHWQNRDRTHIDARPRNPHPVESTAARVSKGLMLLTVPNQ